METFAAGSFQPTHMPLAHLCPVHLCQSEQACPLSQAAPGMEWPGPRAEAGCTYPASSAAHLGGEKMLSGLHAQPVHSCSPSLPVLLGSSPSFLNNQGCSSQPPHKGQLPVPAHLPVLELDQVGKLRPRDWRELNQGHRANHREDQHSSLNPCDLKFVIRPCEPGRVQGKCFRGTLPSVAPTTCR